MIVWINKLFFLFCLFSLGVSATKGGEWGVCDLEDTTQQNPITLYKRPVQMIHRDLCDRERAVTAIDREENKGPKGEQSTTNFLTAKLGFYTLSGEVNVVFKEIHELFSPGSSPLVCDSAAKRSDIKKIPRATLKISIQENSLDLEGLKKSVVQNLQTGRPCDKEALTFLTERTEECEESFTVAAQAFKAFQDELYLYQSHVSKSIVEHHQLQKGIYIDDPLTSGSRNLQEQEESWRKARDKSRSLFDKLIGIFYHSEPRILRIFQEKPFNFIHDPLDAVILHLHSTHNVCDCCRMQFTGACYSWLYSKVKHYNVKLFHIIVTWFEEPYRKIDFKNPQNHTEISEYMAPIEDTVLGGPFSIKTRPFITFVRLKMPLEEV